MKDYSYLVLLILLVMVSRMFFFESNNSFNSIDAVYFHQAVKDYSLIDERPHLPGYYLYVKSIYFINTLFDNIHYSSKVLSLTFTFFSTILLFKSFRKFYNSETSFYTALLILFLPTVIYYTSVSENYFCDLFFSILIFYLGNSKKASVLIPLIFAISVGFRQSTAILLLPISSYLIYYNYKNKNNSLKSLFISMFISIGIFLLWFISMTDSVGGFSNYIKLWETHNPTIHNGVIKNFIGFASNMFYISIPLFLLLLLIIINKPINELKKFTVDKHLLIQLILWCIPSLIIFSTYHYAKGYILICVVGIYFLIAKFVEMKFISNFQMLILTVFLTLFYSFAPTTDKKIELNFQNEELRLKQIDRVNNRLFTSYMPVYDNIRINNERSNSIKNIFLNLSEVNGIFADPSLDFRPELINLLLPNKKLYSINGDNFNKMTYYFELYKQIFYFNEEIINASLIIGNKQFVHKYLKKYVSIIKDDGELSVYSIKNTDEVIAKYKLFFK